LDDGSQGEWRSLLAAVLDKNTMTHGMRLAGAQKKSGPDASKGPERMSIYSNFIARNAYIMEV
jgi:hypothetical protein